MNWLRKASLRRRYQLRPRGGAAKRPLERSESNSAIRACSVYLLMPAFAQRLGQMWKEGEARLPGLKQLRV